MPDRRAESTRRAPRPRGLRRAGRRTNLGLLALLSGAFLSGGLAFCTAAPAPAQFVTFVHGLLGLGVVALGPWKVVVVRRAPTLRLTSLVLVVVVAICLAAGLVEVYGGFGLIGGFSPIQVHVGAASVLLPLIGWHGVRHVKMRVKAVDASRRNLLRSAGFVLAAGAGWTALEGAGALVGSASATRIATGSHRLDVTRIPATSWLWDRVPALAGGDVTLDLAGTPWSVPELDAHAVPVRARLDCTSGWYADATWFGVPLAAVLDPAVLAQARSVVVVSATGYRRRFTVGAADCLWLATRLEGRPLRPGHGAPVRLVAPGHRGFGWVKWVARVELSAQPACLQPPFPLQ